MIFNTVVLYNGLCNRLLPLISILRLGRKYKRCTNIVWNYTPVRSCMTYYGDICKFEDLYEDVYDMSIENNNINHDNTFEFKYWENKDHIIDVNLNGNTYINYALYTIICHEDDTNSIFKNLKHNMSYSRELVFDSIGNELGEVLKSLKPKKELQNEIDNCYKKFYKNMIGIHIRKTDGGFIDFDWNSIIKKYLSECKKWCNKDTENGIFLATDDEDTFKQFKNELGDRLISFNAPNTLCGINSESKFINNKFNVFCAVIDISLLGKCNKYIIGTCDSTFSICGMLLSDKDTRKFMINKADSIPEFV